MIDIGVLKGFAVMARVDLIGEVGARLDVVLAPGSSERVERPGVVVALERVVELEGRDAVIDRVAYTWFNRLIAFRFMDVNGFTRVGVVSPEVGKLTGQPQVLADAKGGDFEVDVVSVKTQAAVTALLNGSRLSVDAQGEAYGLLVEAYCRFWNKVMPFMFEREGDFTELLLPTDLLAANSVRSRAVQVLTEDVCKDVEVIGWLYQFYISERKDEVFAGFKKGKKAGAAEIPAATQLFTPDWIVRYLVENSLGRLWMLNHPDSHLVDQMNYYIAPVDEETDFLKISSPQEIKIIDPACGSGHMLTYAFDLLYAIYLEESHAPSEIPGLILKHNLFGTEIDPRAGSLAAFALTMKARAKQSTFFNRSTEPNICVLQPVSFTPAELDQLVSPGGDRFAEEDFWSAFAQADTLGALIHIDEALIPSMRTQITKLGVGADLLMSELIERAESVILQSEYMCGRYNVFVANPPYMGKRNMNENLKKYAERYFPHSSFDLCTMFIQRGFQLIPENAIAAIIVSESWLFNSAFTKMRLDLLESVNPLVTLLIDKSAFGVRLNTAATIFQKGKPIAAMRFLRVTATDLAEGQPLKLPLPHHLIQVVESGAFIKVPDAPFVFDIPSPLLDLYGKVETLSSEVKLKQGLATTDNARFVRLWWELSRSRVNYGCGSIEEAAESGMRWFPYDKGGTPVRWWADQQHVVNWEKNGEEIKSLILEKYPYLNGNFSYVAKNPEFYFRPAVTWSNIGISGARFRLRPMGFIFDVAGMSAFLLSEVELLNLLGYLNSSLIRRGLDVLAPTLNYQVGDVAKLPFLKGGDDHVRVRRLVEIAHAETLGKEVTQEFKSMSLLESGTGDLQSICLSESTGRRNRTLESAQLARMSDIYWTERICDEAEVDVIEWIESNELETDDCESNEELIKSLVSYAVGCIFGRYSLDEPGLILADQGGMVQDFLVKVYEPSFMPDADNVIPIVDGDWFEDDVVGKFRQFLRVSFGEEHFEENLKFVVDSLGVKNLREYFVKSFYKDHVQRYKKRPIYWLFSSPKGSFNALIYLHRYNSSTVSTVLNDYLREYIKKLEVSLEQQERIVAGGSGAREVSGAQKESDRLRKVLIELADYERDLYALASQQIALDLDDGVLVNYQKFGKALKDIGLKKGASDE